MLASINPLGERARQNRYGLTAAAHVTGAAVGGALAGTAAGALGAALGALADPGPPTVAVIVAVMCAVAALVESGTIPSGMPWVRRQVDEDWLTRYRGWVYGGGFGFQLGLGLATIITTAAVPLALVLALLTQSVVSGVMIGLTFGVVRGAAILLAARVHDAAHLRRLHRTVEARSGISRRVVVAGQIAGAAVALVLVAG